MILLLNIIQLTSRLLTLAVFVDVLLHYFLDPYHPVRRALDRIVEPMLNPIRRNLPPLGMMDFSPVVLIILIQLVERVLLAIIL
ncbi:MAG: YggT family protein [Anaerolineales bacterium]|nr:YggT family protein [Anaerolineales bacterium]